MSLVLAAIFCVVVAVFAGIASAYLALELVYKLFSARASGEQYIGITLGGVIGLAVGLADVHSRNFDVALCGPILAVALLTMIFLAVIGVGKVVIALCR